MLQPEKVSPLHNIIHSADYLFWSFEISKGILRDQKLMIGLDSFTKQILNFWPQYEYESALGKTWNGMDWNGMEWNGMEFYSILSS